MTAEPAIGQRIMRRRQVLDMTQEELALRVGVNRASIGNWESGKHFPKRYLGKLEAVLGISLADGPGRPRPVSDQLRREIAETLEDPEDQRRVIGLLEGTLTWPEPAGDESGPRRREAG